jgi:hypothetical protein
VEADGQILEHLEPYLRETEPDGAAAMLSLVALDEIGFDPNELSASVRRALLVLAAGGDLRRELTADDPAVVRLAEDLDDPDRRAELATALQQLRSLSADLPAAAATLDALLADPDRAWQALATAILADELTED